VARLSEVKHIGAERWIFTGIRTWCGKIDKVGSARNAPDCPDCLRIKAKRDARG
jgi:hypothetical protein